ncbi:UDP-N-acetylmuramoyl-tripeptide--D-alanyl-D-alanine ligase [Pararhodobacter sp.]|uniref:UDP-N-acetylmuramoyl-tripeptide--D-alanyl-D- alanine ligase n=1 Tax=Pararhodobacter sp. TaxID=2127056 RepID=UPI002AFF110B|nr:UDP-N-acetylmuramoyl-tripeptide--D-alanyl-D-alanine ligase [Pararhodobacter sp.]
MSVLWSHGDAAAATGGQVTAPFNAAGLSIDTRSLQPGDLFVALKAARDGHDFVAQAFAKGAAAALVDHVPQGVTGPCLVVKDVLQGLVDLGAAGRARSKARVIGVTGSVGKTSTKEMLRDMFDAFGSVHAAEASFNNHWGVPITLARLPQDADFAVIEIGMNHPGEIAPLAALTRPHVAMITTVAPAHLEAFADIDAIAHEKAAIFSGLEPGGTAVYNADLPTSAILAKAAGPKALSFGTAGDLRLKSMRVTPSALVVEAQCGAATYLMRLADAGAHFGMNALGCLAVAQALDLDLALAAQALGRWRPPSGRGRRETVLLDPATDERLTLIDDAFNANPASMSAAIDVLAATTPGAKGRRIAILGDMLELGPDEVALHRGIAAHPALASVTLVHCVGPRMRALYDVLPPRMQGKYVETADELGAKAHGLVRPGDVVLVKGSKGSYVSRVVDALRHLGHPLPDDPNGE